MNEKAKQKLKERQNEISALQEKIKIEKRAAILMEMSGQIKSAEEREENVKWLTELLEYKKDGCVTKDDFLNACKESAEHMDEDQGVDFVCRVMTILEEL